MQAVLQVLARPTAGHEAKVPGGSLGPSTQKQGRDASEPRRGLRSSESGRSALALADQMAEVGSFCEPPPSPQTIIQPTSHCILGTALDQLLALQITIIPHEDELFKALQDLRFANVFPRPTTLLNNSLFSNKT